MSRNTNLGTRRHIPEALWKPQTPCLFMIYVVKLLVTPSYIEGGNDYRITERMWTQMILAQFEIMSWHFTGLTEGKP